MKILLLEDDAMLQEIIKEHLESLNHTVIAVGDGIDAETVAMAEHFDLWLFDINVPSQNGMELLQGLRNTNNATPAIFITAQTDAKIVLKAFDSGGDDYLKKPFDLVELDARIGYIQKKMGLDKEVLDLDENTHFNFETRSLEQGGKLHHLSKKEAKLLQFLATHPKQVHSHETLTQVIWENGDAPMDNTLRTYIKKLRQILTKDSIVTIHGSGYSFEY